MLVLSSMKQLPPGVVVKAANQTILVHEISKLQSKQAQWDPFTWYKEMRENNPVYYDAEQDVWNVFLYEHVKQVLFDHQLFSNKKERSLIPTEKIAAQMST